MLRESVADFGAEVAGGGGSLLGLFTPQLGWRAREAVVLTAWRSPLKREALLGRFSRMPGVSAPERTSLFPTVRPRIVAPPRPGGVYVHRWFRVRGETVGEFVSLSENGWAEFETANDAQVYGLFTAGQDVRDPGGTTRLLLITRYGSHKDWEASRPSTRVIGAFRRRQELTLDSWAASSELTPLV